MRQRPAESAAVNFSAVGANLEVALLGPLAVTRNGTTIDITGPKRRALLALLAINAGTPVSRERIIEALWPGRQTGKEESTLRVHISHLRDAVEPHRGDHPTVIVTRGSAYMLATDAVDVDIQRFYLLTQEGRGLLGTDAASALDLLNGALGLWRGRPLQDAEYEEFAQEDIRRLEAARIEAVIDRSKALIELGEAAAAVQDLEPLVRVDPTRERPVSLLMLALYRSGRQGEALRIAGLHARRLTEQGLVRSPRIGEIEERILQHDASLLPQGTISRADIRPGRSVRGYELREEVGTGSIGVVYRAFQSSIGREVALRVIDPRFSEEPEFIRRFSEATQVVAGLEHPRIVPLYDFWRDPAGAFLVMRWMDGRNLRWAIPALCAYPSASARCSNTLPRSALSHG